MQRFANNQPIEFIRFLETALKGDIKQVQLQSD